MAGRAERLPAAVRARARDPRILIVTKANSRSTVHRPTYLDYIGVKQFDAAGQVVGERRFLGLFTSAAYAESIHRVPVVQRKAAEVLRRSGFSAESHSGKDVLAVLETYPRDELFQADVDHLLKTVLSVLHLQERRRTRLFVRTDDYGRYVSCLVYLPRDRYNTAVRLRMEAVLREAFDGFSVDYTTRVSESVLARLHFVVRTPRGKLPPTVDVAELEARLVAATRTWEEDLAESLLQTLGEDEGRAVARRFAKAFPEAYKEDFAAGVAVSDLQHVRALDDPVAAGQLQMSLYREPQSPDDERRLKLFRAEPVSLTQMLPLFSDLGLEVVDERPYELRVPGREGVHIYDFGLRAPVAPTGPPTTALRPASPRRLPRSGPGTPRATGSTPLCSAPT
jgi:glutamate dehydrogenase